MGLNTSVAAMLFTTLTNVNVLTSVSQVLINGVLGNWDPWKATFREEDLPGLGRLVVLPVACVIRVDYKAQENLLSEETSVTDTNPNSSRDLFR